MTKRPVTMKITSDSQLRKLPAMMAQRIAMRLKGGAPKRRGGSRRTCRSSHSAHVPVRDARAAVEQVSGRVERPIFSRC